MRSTPKPQDRNWLRGEDWKSTVNYIPKVLPRDNSKRTSSLRWGASRGQNLHGLRPW